jgi:hypothetical protein
MSSELPLPFGFSDKSFLCISRLSHACYVPDHLILPDIIRTLLYRTSPYRFRLAFTAHLQGVSVIIFPTCKHHMQISSNA